MKMFPFGCFNTKFILMNSQQMLTTQGLHVVCIMEQSHTSVLSQRVPNVFEKLGARSRTPSFVSNTFVMRCYR